MEVERDASSYLIGRRIGSSFTSSLALLRFLYLKLIIIHFFVVSSSS